MNYPFSGIIVRYLHVEDTAHQSKHVPASEDQPPALEDQLHVNLWHLAERDYLDIGILVSSPKDVKEIWLDLPWRVTPESLSDLGSMLDGEKMITAIFNELVSYDGKSEEVYAKVTLQLNSGVSNTFAVVRLGRRCFVFEYHPGSSGSTRIKIKWPHLKGSSSDLNLSRYIRLRISCVPLGVFFSTFRPKDRNLLSSSSITRLFDFRVNVRRGIPDEILLGEPQLRFPQCQRIHLFVIVDREVELVFQSDSFKGCRSLEDEAIWNDYLGLSKHQSQSLETVRDYLGYQWSVAAKRNTYGIEHAKDLVALGRFVHTTSSKWNNGRFILLVILLGACGSALWDIFKANLLSTEDKNGTLTAGHMGFRLAIMIIMIIGLLLSDRETAFNVLRAAKRGIVWVLKNVKNAWERLD